MNAGNEMLEAKQSGFEIVDYGESRRDLHSRTEVKYTLQDPDLGKLRQMLGGCCQAVSHNRRISVVQSLYYDDPAMSACHANLSGLGVRRKLRLRWYDTKYAPAKFFLEIKWRNNRVTGKHRFEVQSDTPLYQLSFKEIHRRLMDVTPEKLARDFMRFSEPIMVVQYRREHFVSPDAALRMTLDYDIQFYDQVGRTSLTMTFPKRQEGLVVVEGKTPIGREMELRAFVRPLAPRAGRCSKYVHGCEMLGHIRSGI